MSVGPYFLSPTGPAASSDRQRQRRVARKRSSVFAILHSSPKTPAYEALFGGWWYGKIGADARPETPFDPLESGPKVTAYHFKGTFTPEPQCFWGFPPVKHPTLRPT